MIKKMEKVYDNLIENNILQEIINIMSIMISVRFRYGKKIKISRIKYLEGIFFLCINDDLTEYNTKCYAVTSQNKGGIKVQKIEDVDDDKNIIYEVNPIEKFIGKSQLCDTTKTSGAKDKGVFDGNTFLLEIGKQNNKPKYVYIGGDMVCSFLTNDKSYKYIAIMGNNLIPYSIAIGWENIHYLTPYFKFIKKKILTNMILINYLILIMMIF